MEKEVSRPSGRCDYADHVGAVTACDEGGSADIGIFWKLAYWAVCRRRHTAHLLRRCRELQTDHPRAPLPAQVHTVLQQALQVRDRHAAGTISAHGVAVARGHLMARLTAVLDHPTTVPAVRRFAAHLDREWPALFSFLYDPTIDATNWRAEQALRPAVVNRKVSGGNRTWLGAHTQQVLATLFRTSSQRQLDPLTILVDLLRERVPRIAAALFPT